MKLKPSITPTPSIYFNFGLMKGFSVPSGVTPNLKTNFEITHCVCGQSTESNTLS
jgi:hypothetical protein